MVLSWLTGLYGSARQAVPPPPAAPSPTATPSPPSPPSAPRRDYVPAETTPPVSLRLDLTPNRAGLNPSPNWSLDDLNRELDDISRKQQATNFRVLPVSDSKSLMSDSPSRGTRPKRGGTFRMSVYDDSENSDEDEAVKDTAQTRWKKTKSVSPEEIEETTEKLQRLFHVRRETVEEAALFEAQQAQLKEFQETARRRRKTLERALWEERQAELEAVTNVEKQAAARLESLRQIDVQEQRAIAEARDEYLSGLQREHEHRTQVGERKLKRDAAAEEAKRRELAAAQERERLAKAKAAAEAAKREMEQKAAEAKKKAQEDASAAAKTMAEMDTKAKEAAKQREAAAGAAMAMVGQSSSSQGGVMDAINSATSGVSKARVAEKATQEENIRLQKLREVEKATLPLTQNEGLKKERRALERQVNLLIQQISATQEQISLKANDLLRLLMDPSKPHQLVALWFANKLLFQCEAQVQQLSSFAFVLAQVVVEVSTQVPLVMDLVLARLNEVCIYTVPKYYVHTKEAFPDETIYFKAIGYREVDGRLESTDAYVARMASYVALYSAIAQTAPLRGSQPNGLKEGWIWCARMLNKLPPNRITASILQTFLKVAGYKLHLEYPRPFQKVLVAIQNEYLPLLKAQNDPDSAAEYNKLETYIGLRKYLEAPEGMRFPSKDLSSLNRA